jgi:hypothetical protein
MIRINPRDVETTTLEGGDVPAYSLALGALAGLQALLI